MPSAMIHMLVAEAYDPKRTPALMAGSVAPDAVEDRSFKDRFHLRDVPDRFEALADWARSRDLSDPYSDGFILHMYTDILWDNGPQAELRTPTGNEWFRPYRRAIHRTSCRLYHVLPWAPPLWDEMLRWADAQGGAMRMGLPMNMASEFLHKTHGWHVDNDPEDFGYYTREKVEAFASIAAESYSAWKASL